MRSQSFSEPVALDCELTSVSLCFFIYLFAFSAWVGEDGWSEKATADCSWEVPFF